MIVAKIFRTPSPFRRDRLPSPAEYFAEYGPKLIGRGEWRDAVCPFHPDTRPSLRVKAATGAFRCMVCAAHGRDVLDLHILRTRLSFPEAARALGAWEERG